MAVDCIRVARIAGFLLSSVLTIVAFALATQNTISVYTLHATNMTQVTTRYISQFDVTYIPSIILLISSACQAIQLSLSTESAKYVRQADWMLTVPIMMALISTLSGTRDIWMICSHAFIAMAVITSGILMDAIDSVLCWLAFAMGCMLMLFSWTSVIWHLSRTTAPDEILAVVIIQLLLFTSYPATALICRIKRAHLEKEELAYNILGTITKSLLALIIVFGVKGTAGR